MPQPVAYTRSKDFSTDAASNTDHNAINAELDSAASSINAIRTNIALIQNDTGALVSGIVTTDALAPAVLAPIAASETAAATAATNAQDAATAASNDAAAANASKIAAATSESNAAAHASAAQTAVAELDAAVTAAEGSATNAANSALAAQTARAGVDEAVAQTSVNASSAATSANQAATHAGNASNDAYAVQIAKASVEAKVADAQNAAQSASDDAATIAGNLAASQTYANNAALSAGSAHDYSQAAAVSASAASTSATQAAGSESAAANSANIATTKANQVLAAALNVDAANAAATSAQTSASAASSSAITAGQARDAAILASQVATAANENLAAIAKEIHRGAIVDAFLYDTAKDSDGGAWRLRCLDKSWYTETIVSGKWLGQKTNEAAARATAGVATGDYYQNTTDGKFYSLNANSGVTEVFRGNRRDFPAVAGIVAETSRVIIYDLTTPDAAMWMVFTNTASGQNLIGTAMLGSLKSVAAINGVLMAGSTATNEYQGGVAFASFAADTLTKFRGAGVPGLINFGTVSQRHAGANGTALNSVAIVNGVVNDIAATVLPDAPVDPVSGLPVPTVAVATAGGVSVIRQDGTVVNSSYAQLASTVSIKGTTLYYQKTSIDWGFTSVSLAGVASGFNGSSFDSSSIPNLRQTGRALACSRYIATHNANGAGVHNAVTLSLENPAAPTKGMVAYLHTTYNTGWQVGDARLTALADTNPEVIAASGELAQAASYVVPATHDNTLSGVTNSSFNAVGGTTQTRVVLPFATVANRTYCVPVKLDSISTGSLTIYARNGNDGTGTILSTNVIASAGGTALIYFVATGTVSCINWVNSAAGSSFSISGVSVQLAEPDRSVKGKGLRVVGSLTKAAVASGSQLVAYSGFSGANYLEQPYDSGLDFGTGDFCVMGWVKTTAVAGNQDLYIRGIGDASSGDVTMYLDSAMQLRFLYQGVSDVQSGLTVPTNQFALVGYMRASGKGYFFVNDRVANVDFGAATSLTKAAAKMQLGLYMLNGNLALWRISATAPSQDQIRMIYETEKKLFEANAKCTIDGSSTAVTALAYDDAEDALHVGTSWGRSKFKDLVRVESAVTSVGASTSIAAGAGSHISGGATGARYVQSSINVRDALSRKEEAKRAAGRIPVNLDYDAAASQTAFVLPRGFTAHSVFVAGAEKREGTTKDFTRSFDGFVETVNFAVAPGAGVWVRIKAARS